MIWTFASADAAKAHQAREQFVRMLRVCGARQEDLNNAELIFGELVGNVVRHAPGAILVRFDWTGDDAMLSVQDQGVGFEYHPALPAAFEESGRGLFIVARLAKHVTVQRLDERGFRVCVVLDAQRAKLAPKPPASNVATQS